MISIFASDFQISRTYQSQIFFCDATFTVPKGFYQIWTVLAFCSTSESYIPVVHFLMNNKKKKTYNLALKEWKQLLNDKLGKNYSNFKPKSFTTDFELAEMKAVFDSFNSSRIKDESFIIVGDSFHFAQALFRQLKHLGLTKKVSIKCIMY
jgi:hypothetical protein